MIDENFVFFPFHRLTKYRLLTLYIVKSRETVDFSVDTLKFEFYLNAVQMR